MNLKASMFLNKLICNNSKKIIALSIVSGLSLGFIVMYREKKKEEMERYYKDMESVFNIIDNIDEHATLGILK